MIINRFFLALFATLALTSMAHAQPSRSDEIDNARSAYSEVRAALEQNEVENAPAIEERLRSLRDSSRQRLNAVQREIDVVKGQLEPLGPAPGENDPPESEELAAERQALNEDLIRLNSQRTRINANILEANDLLGQISARQIQSLYSRLLTRDASPLLPSVWGGAAVSANDVSGRISAYFSGWGDRKGKESNFWISVGIIIAALVVSLLLFGPVNRWFVSTFSQHVERRRPTQTRRVVVAGLKMLARAAPGVIGGLIIIETLRAQGVLIEKGADAARALWFSLLAYLLVSGFMSSLFTASRQEWRFREMDLAQGRQISGLINGIVIAYGLKVLLAAVLVAAGGDPLLLQFIEAVSAVIVALFLYALCRTKLWSGIARPATVTGNSTTNSMDSDKRSRGNWRLIRRLGRGLAITTGIGAILGYVNFANFSASRIYYLTVFVALIWFVRAVLKESAFLFRMRLGEKDEDIDEEEEDRREANFQFWVTLFVNIALFIAVIPGLLVLFGMPVSNVQDLAGQALFRF